MIKNKLIKLLTFCLLASCVTAPTVEAAWGWRRRRHHRDRYIVPTLVGGLALASVISASNSSDRSALRSDLNRVIDAVNTQNNNIKQLSDDIRRINNRLDDLEKKVR